MAAGEECTDEVRVNAAAWVLGALDPGDFERFTDHLLTCKDCQRMVADLEAAGRLLTMTSPAARAPASLAAAALARVRQAASQP
jgi:anti-sigma factor RsiW